MLLSFCLFYKIQKLPTSSGSETKTTHIKSKTLLHKVNLVLLIKSNQKIKIKKTFIFLHCTWKTPKDTNIINQLEINVNEKKNQYFLNQKLSKEQKQISNLYPASGI